MATLRYGMADAKPHLFRRLWLRLLATAGIAAAVLLSWWLRIDQARAPSEIATTGFGETIDLGRSLFTPEALQLRRSPDQPDQLVLTASVENVTGKTQNAVFGSPEHPPLLTMGENPLAPPEIVLIRDDAPLYELQPRIPEKIALVWTLAAPWQPQTVEIAFSRQTFKLRDNLYGQASWLVFVPEARMTAEPEAAP
ncbi:hypothetical protein [Paracoccus onubensis]|nr:hypothetical protein [Paracoccus onubensis]